MPVAEILSDGGLCQLGNGTCPEGVSLTMLLACKDTLVKVEGSWQCLEWIITQEVWQEVNDESPQQPDNLDSAATVGWTARRGGSNLCGAEYCGH